MRGYFSMKIKAKPIAFLPDKNYSMIQTLATSFAIANPATGLKLRIQ